MYRLLDIAEALNQRNEIENMKLEFKKKSFEFRKQLDMENTKSNVAMAETFNKYAELLQGLNDMVKNLAQNQAVLYQQMQEIKDIVTRYESKLNNGEDLS